MHQVHIDRGWYHILQEEFQKEYFVRIRHFLVEEIKKGYTIFPPLEKILYAFQVTPWEQVQVVILWQDPYPMPWQAHGLCFSVPDGIALPQSLQNIFKELSDDLHIPPASSWNLERWGKQWVFLLNAILSVRAWKPWSHSHIWWEQFTDRVIECISLYKEHVVFMLWGNYARNKKKLIDPTKHYILEAPHPSPLSASKGFFWCKHFSKCNAYLLSVGKTPIEW